MNKTYNLNSSQELNWQLYFGLQDEDAPLSPDDLSKGSFQMIPADVPGNVEIDLEKAGIIKDPMIGNNVYELRKFETYQWWYRCQ